MAREEDMTVRDDRLEFEENKRKQSIALGNDATAFQQSLDLVTALDSYDYSYL